MKRTMIIAICGGMACSLPAQTWLRVHADGTLPDAWSRPMKVSATSVEARKQAVVAGLWQQGHLEAAIDSCQRAGDSLICALHLGPVYRWARLSPGGVDEAIISEVHFRERYFDHRPIDPRRMARLYEDLLDRCENAGFPFAALTLDSLRSDSNTLHATLRLDKGRFVRIDSVVVRGSARVNERYLQASIGIRPGDPYNETLIAQAEKRTRELPFVAQRGAPYVLFTQEHTKLYLFLDAKKASSVNGILGVLPDPVSGKVNFTGDMDLKLRNALRHGEAIDLNWRSLKDKTQDLKARLNYPYLFHTPFGTDLSLKLFKRDTTFLEVTTRAAVDLLFGRNDRLSVFVNRKTSDRLGRAESFPPGLADVDLSTYGLGIERERFDYRFNPRRGLGVSADASAGTKRSTTGTLLDAQPPEEVRSTQYELNGRVVGHLPLGGRGTLRLAAQGGSMVNEQLFANELYRMGGIKSMRGVDEASIYCSSFAIGTAELRFILDENSNAFVFVDQGWWEDRSQDALVTDAPLGFGAGTSFETKAGIFGLTYALGRQFDRPVDLRESKVHFGFTSLF